MAQRRNWAQHVCQADRASIGPFSTGPTMPRLKTYIVEDSFVIRENLIATLEELAAIDVVGTAEDERTAVAWLSRPERPVDLVIIDIFLKSGSGLGVLPVARTLPRPCELVVLTNYATPDIRRRCMELGADQVFDKSNEIDALILHCSRLAAARSIERRDRGLGAAA
jgi:DNA-binding NarL/FixJ family response regulator